MSFQERLSQIMEKNSVSVAELARAVGVSRQSVMRWQNGTSPSFDKVEKLSEYFGVSLEYFYQDLISEEHIQKVLADSRNQKTGWAVPLIGNIQAGYPVESFENPDGFVISDQRNIGNLFALRVKGDSMLPIVMDGDVIICDKNAVQIDGKICAVTVDNESTLKRVKQDSAGVTLIPTNPMYPELRYSNQKAEELGFHVDGVLVQMIRNF